MLVLVFGGRYYDDTARLRIELDKIHQRRRITLLIHGACPYGGADIAAENWAKDREVPYVGVPAKFKERGRRAGPERNTQVLAEWRPNLAVEFPGGSGTADMRRKAKAAGVRVEQPLDKEL